MKKKKLKIVFAGSGFFALKQIINLYKKYKNIKVITQKNTNPLKEGIKDLKLTTFEAGSKKELEKILKNLKPDLLIVSDFGIILSSKSLSIPKLTINTHPSLLPKYRGPSPYVTTILNGEKESGVTIIELTEEIDEGPIFLQEKISIKENETQITLREKLADLASKMLSSNLEKMYYGKIKPIPQDNKKATYTKTFIKKDGEINWHEKAHLIERKIRALNPWPGTFTYLKLRNGKKLRVKILGSYIEKNNNLKPNQLKIKKNKLKIKALDSYIIVIKIQPEGKKEMDVKEFLNGYKNILILKN